MPEWNRSQEGPSLLRSDRPCPDWRRNRERPAGYDRRRYPVSHRSGSCQSQARPHRQARRLSLQSRSPPRPALFQNRESRPETRGWAHYSAIRIDSWIKRLKREMPIPRNTSLETRSAHRSKSPHSLFPSEFRSGSFYPHSGQRCGRSCWSQI